MTLRIIQNRTKEEQTYILARDYDKMKSKIIPIFKTDDEIKLNLPFFSCAVEAGFPSPVDDHLEASLDLNSYLIKHPAATFFVRVSGESMVGAGIFNNDILVVDRSIKPSNGKVVIAVLEGQLTVKRLEKVNGRITLKPENKKFNPIHINENSNLIIWGVATSVIHFL